MSWTLSKHTTETQLCRSCLQIPWEDLFRNFAQLYSGQFDDVSDPDNPPKILLCYVLHSNRVEMEAALMQQCDLCQTLITGNSDGELTQKSHSDSLQDEVQVHLHLSLVGWMQDKYVFLPVFEKLVQFWCSKTSSDRHENYGSRSSAYGAGNSVSSELCSPRCAPICTCRLAVTPVNRFVNFYRILSA